MATPRSSDATPSPPSSSRPAPRAVDLLKGLGLFVDGPVLWGRPIRSARPGVFIIELGESQPHPPVDPNLLRAWLERVPDLRLDGARPTVGELQGRLARLWLPEQTVLYAWYSAKAVGARVAAMHRTVLGDPRPNASGQLLKTLRSHDQLRVWWAETDAPQEYADALLTAFAAAADAAAAARLFDPSVVLPFANDRAADLTPRKTGITGGTLPAADDRPRPVGHVTVVPPEPEPPRRPVAEQKPRPRPPVRPMRPAPVPAGRAAPASAAPSALTDPEPKRRATKTAAASFTPVREPVYLSAEGIEALRAELHELETERRPQILSRLKAARELGDLSENADYEAARHEQSFNEGRIQTLTSQLERAVVIDATGGGHLVALGSTVVVDSDREGEETFTIVGTLEADAAAGRISNSSPIGRALVGHRAGETVTVSVPAGAVHYRILEVR
ncbi:MAG TPA: transcription elongation factor GreA [Candidatus Limnocylindrales bacterium]